MAELARKGDGGRIGRTIGAALAAVGRDPVLAGVREVLEVERSLGITSTWFVLCGTPTLGTTVAGDLTYRPESRHARSVFSAIRAAGHEIALHGSFATMDEPGAFADQRRRLAALVEYQPDGVRQHFLRMRPGATQVTMQEAGFRYDATYGFPDRNGFRLGVADVVPAWSEAEGRALPLEEVPLVWMDRALSKYRGVENPEVWAADAIELAEACRQVEGVWVGLWHPNLTAPMGFPGAPAAFAQVARRIVEQEPFMAPVGRLVAWRVARRGVRASKVLPDGSVLARGPAGSGETIVLEDGTGRPAERASQR